MLDINVLGLLFIAKVKNNFEFFKRSTCIFKKKSYLCIAFENKHSCIRGLERWQSGRLRRS